MTEEWEWDESVTSNGVVGATRLDQEGRRNPRRRACTSQRMLPSTVSC